MARLWYDAGGAILRLVKNDAGEALFGAPASAVGSLAFDEATNAAAIADLDTQWNVHTCPAGVLKKSGVNVTINADGPTKGSLDGLLASADNAVAANVTYLAIASPNNAQVVAQVRALTQQNNAIIKRLVLFGRKVI